VIKILFPFVGDSIGGSHRSILELHNALERSGSVTSIFVLHEIGPLSKLLDDIDIQYECIPIKHLAGESPNLLKIASSIIFNFFKLKKFIRNNKVDIVHGNDLRINLTWSLPTRLSGSVYLWHQRSIMSSSVLWKFSKILANYFVAISECVYQSLPSNIPKSKKILILNPFNITKIYKAIDSRRWIDVLYNVPKNSILCGYIGRLVDWKNVDFLIICFTKYAKKSNLNLHLIIVGTGDDKYVGFLKSLVFKLKAQKIITFVGFNSESHRIISSFDLMVAPSSQEPFGRTLVESMIQKTAVLAARGGGHSEIIDNGVTGRLYDHGNIESFMNQCDLYFNDEKSKCKIINTANTMAILKYSSDKHAQNIMQIYRSLLNT